MDIVTHVLSGALAGGTTALVIRGARARVVVALTWGALGGFLPDIDVASRVPGFDATIGRALALQPGSVIYGGSHWYSHHHFTHSLAAALAVGLLVSGLLGLERVLLGADPEGRRTRNVWLAPLCVVAGYLMHLLGDLVTPGSVWGGIQLLWPSDTMVGGWGWTWWFNNYDVFLVQLVGLLLLGFVALVPRTQPVMARLLPAVVLGLVVASSALLLNLREHDYAYEGHAEDYWALEEASLEEQRRLLPPELFELMSSLDRSLALPF